MNSLKVQDVLIDNYSIVTLKNLAIKYRIPQSLSFSETLEQVSQKILQNYTKAHMQGHGYDLTNIFKNKNDLELVKLASSTYDNRLAVMNAAKENLTQYKKQYPDNFLEKLGRDGQLYSIQLYLSNHIIDPSELLRVLGETLENGRLATAKYLIDQKLVDLSEAYNIAIKNSAHNIAQYIMNKITL